MTQELAESVKQFPDVSERFGQRMASIELHTGAGLMSAQDFDFSSLYRMALSQQQAINALVQLVGEMHEANLFALDGFSSFAQYSNIAMRLAEASAKSLPIAQLAKD